MKSNLLKIIASFTFVVLSVFAANAQSNNNKNKVQNGEQTNDSPLKIIEKQPPSAKVFGDCFRQNGTAYIKIAVRVTFDKSGKITAVEIVKESDCSEFDEESLRVARRIKFKPATKDGEPITVTKTVVYEGGIR
jgi:TonB family protein